MRNTDKAPDAKVLLPTRAVRQRYSTSDASIERWLADPNVGMPPPIYIGRMRYWRLAELEAWETSRRRTKATAQPVAA